MSKKVSLIIAIFMALIGIVIVSTFGLIPENLRQIIMVTDISFQGDDIIVTNKDGKIRKTLIINFNANNNTINLGSKVVHSPSDATDTGFQYISDQPISAIKISIFGLVTIDDFSLNSFQITVKTTDGSNKSDTITIMKPSQDQEDFDHRWIWG